MRPALRRLLVLLLAVAVVLRTNAQMILNPTAYDLGRNDVSLDATPKCTACRHIILSLRNHFVEATSLSPTSIVYEADPCAMAPPMISAWCPDVNKKLQLCPRFLASVFDRSMSAVKICESCGYDQFPLPPVRFCDNAIYMPLGQTNDNCETCQNVVRQIQTMQDPCAIMSSGTCTEIQNSLSRCSAFVAFVHQPFSTPRRICAECAVDLPDGTNPPGMMPNMYCDNVRPSPLQDASPCSLCMNVIHNQRNFPMDDPCANMDDSACSFVQDSLLQCSVYNRMLDQFTYPAVSICEECVSNANPLAPVKFCTAAARPGSPATQFNRMQPYQQTNYFPGTFAAPTSPFLKPEPPASFASPWWLKQQYNGPTDPGQMPVSGGATGGGSGGGAGGGAFIGPKQLGSK